MDTTSAVLREHYYGIEFDPSGELIVAETIDGKPRVTGRYPSDDTSVSALKQQISRTAIHPRICIRSAGAAALGVALALMAMPSAEVLIVAPRALELTRGPRSDATPPTPEESARRLAAMAKRMV